MRTIRHTLAGEDCVIRVPEHDDDAYAMMTWVQRHEEPLAWDTETTGLDVYSPDWRLRALQVGDRREAWVLDVERWPGVARAVLESLAQPVAFNLAYDGQAAARGLGIDMDRLYVDAVDVHVLAHLVDPRTRQEGGLGLRLKELSQAWVDPAADDGQHELQAAFRSIGHTQATGWAAVPFDNEAYQRYAGLDVLLTRRLHDALAPIVEDIGSQPLSRFELELQRCVAHMQRQGMLVDVEYTTRLRQQLADDETRYRAVAAEHGVASVDSPKRVAEGLIAMGETLTARTGTGSLAVGKDVLLPLADLSFQWERIGAREPNPLADAVVRAKRARSWGKTYAQALLDGRDAADRIHPDIRSLQARTGRMSVSRPPLQQLPSSDSMIRTALIADPGHTIIASDYAQIEMRVLAAISGDRALTEVIASGGDLHTETAKLMHGASWDGLSEAEQKKARKIAKSVGFGKVYGGGAGGIARLTGAPVHEVQAAIRGYDRAYPGVKRLSTMLQRQAEYGKKEVVTPAGRHLPLDRDRLYAATNYLVQSTARDILAQAIVDAHAEGIGHMLLLPVHDELIAQAPTEHAHDAANTLGRIMRTRFGGVEIPSEPEVYGPSWGHGYL